MDKKDILYGAAAVAIILIMALFVKPVMTGQPVNTGIPVPTTIPVPPDVIPPPVTPFIPATAVTTKIPAPSPTQTWNKTVMKVGFVDASVYGVNLTEELPNGTRIDNIPVNTSMTSYAKITGQYSGTTQIIHIPFPYWELVYTIDPVEMTKPGSVTVTPTKGSGVAAGSGIQGSYSSALPEFTIQVMDANDPNRVVRTITPPGGIDLNLWMGTKGTINPASTPKKGRGATPDVTIYPDPRPLTE